MAQQTLNAPASPYDGPATRDTGDERGDKWQGFVQKCQAMFTELYNLDAVGGTTAGQKLGRASYTALAADDTAGTVDIDLGLTTIVAPIVQILRAGVDVTDDAVITWAAGTVTVADGAVTYALTAGDVINIIAVGT